MAGWMALALSLSTLGMAQQVVLPVPTAKLYPETKDRLSDERMEALVMEPSQALAKGELALAETRFAVLLAAARTKEGPKSLTAADLEMSFGVALFMAGKFEGLEGAGEASIRHLERSVTAYAAHFGRVHGETALALTSLADAMGELSDGGKVTQRIPLMRESLAIRQVALGDGHPETVANRVDLIVLLTHPDIDDRKYFEEAATLAADARRKAPAGMPAGHELSADRLGLAEALPMIRMGRVDEGLAQVKRVMAGYKPDDGEGASCFGMTRMLDRVRAALVAAGAKQRESEVKGDLASMCLGNVLGAIVD